MLNFKVKVAQRYFIWPVLRFCRVPYQWLKQSSGRECQSRSKYWQNEDMQLSADWECSVTVISADQQKEHTLLFQTIVNLIFTLFYNFNLWKILYRMPYIQFVCTPWTRGHYCTLIQSSALYCAARLMIGGNYWYAGLSVQRRVVQPGALYRAVRLLIHGNYW